MRSPWIAPLFLFACAKDPAPPNGGGSVFWKAIDFTSAEDLGHEAKLIPDGERRAPGRIALTDVTDRAGLSSALGGGNSHGVGVAFVDLDGDEWPEIFVANGMIEGGRTFPSQLFKNRGDGSFSEVSESSGVSRILGGRDTFSVAAGDYDKDGDVDLYVGAQPTDVLLENRGDGTFEDATGRAGAGGPRSDPSLARDGRSKVVSFGDFDQDGDLDLVSASSTLPDPFAYLLENQGDGTFSDVSDAWEVKASDRGNPCAVLWSDYDNDGDVDLWIWNDRGGHVLLRNDRGSFEDVTSASRLDEVTITHPMGIDAADIDHDGDLDYYISNIGNNPLLRNNGDGTFTDITHDAGTEGEFGWGLAFEDFDLDGWPDIFVAQEDNLAHLVFKNQGGDPPTFEQIEVPHPNVKDSGDAHNVAVGFADYDRDGLVDVVVVNTDGSRIELYRNETDPGSHRSLRVVLDRERGPRAFGGINARVAVGTGDLVQFRDVTGGSSRASQNELSVRFGLGDWSGAEWAAVLRLDGSQEAATGVEAGEIVLPME
jgi:enediyne biosynthesis protein E4